MVLFSKEANVLYIEILVVIYISLLNCEIKYKHILFFFFFSRGDNLNELMRRVNQMKMDAEV
jgi:hypothetical protein